MKAIQITEVASEQKAILSLVDLKLLIEAFAKLNVLEAGGVDNWEWFEASMDGYDAELSNVQDELGIPSEHR